jgi:dipeptidyl aminopeptidase/acylaminoacyl peptidase
MRRVLLLLLLLWLPAAAIAQHPRESRAADEVIRLLGEVRSFYQTAISPDGARVAWVESQRREGGTGTAIAIAELRSPDKVRRISAGGDDSFQDQVAWSPDSRRIAFLSDGGKPGQQQLYVADAAGGKAKKLTNLKGFLSSPAWSPDGQSIAVLFIENAPRAAGPLQPMTPPAGVVGRGIYEQRLNVVSVADGALRAVSPADLYIYEYDWLPDASGFVATAAQGDGDNNWWVAQLYQFNLSGQMRAVYKPRRQVANPRVSPDGKQVAFIEGLMSDQGSTGGDVYVLPLAGGEARNLTPGQQASATVVEWAGNDELAVAEIADGNAAIATVSLQGGARQVWSGAEFVTAGNWDVGVSFARDGRSSAVIRSSAQHAPEIWAGENGRWRQVTKENVRLKPLWGEQRSLHWKSAPYEVQGWLLFPRNYDPAKRYPLVVHVHGGPAAACTAGWPSTALAPLAAAGYFVLCPNPRGSYGQGVKFTEGIVRDFGGGDLRDIVAGVDEVLRALPVDAKRVGLQGWSYGGYMAMWAETQTDRFAAVIAGAGIANWTSYYGENDIDQWLAPYFGASVYDDPAAYARSEPMRFAKQVKTPTLILVGDRDGECPAPQSFEWWHALQHYGVPVEFVVYANEGHQIQQPEHRRDIIVRSLGWFDQYLRAK